MSAVAYAIPPAANSPAGKQEVPLAQAKALLLNNPDSALVLAQEEAAHLNRWPTAWQRAHVLMFLGDAHEANAEAAEAMAAYQRAEQLMDAAESTDATDTSVILTHVDLQIRIGQVYFDLRDLDKSEARFNDALGKLDAARTALTVPQVNTRKVMAFNNIAGGYIYRREYDLALPYFQQSLVMNRPLDNPRHASALNNNIGICYMEMDKYDVADQHFLQSLAMRKQADDVRGQAQVLNNMGKNQALQGRFQAARRYFEEALALGRSINNRSSMAISLESLSSALDTLGEYQAALKAHREFKALNDSLYNDGTRSTIARMEVQFRRDKEKKVFELEAKRQEAEIARRRTLNIALASALVLLITVVVLAFKVMRAKVRNSALKQETLRLESAKLATERTMLQEGLEYKDRELTANALFLLKRNELIAHVVERLLKAKQGFRQENQKIVQDIIHDLQAGQDEHNWKEFEAQFTRVHSSFYQTLQERFPSLTPNERKLCAFLRLNLSTKDISAITQQSLNSITVARSRLRKKLLIDGEEVQLIDFLQSI
ncbi:MAG: tetratricopeptide repeat protein [Flavobacteriales bacterium]|nr:tetratricopeptide repeat protein [Flavobacteriales bacterium]